MAIYWQSVLFDDGHGRDAHRRLIASLSRELQSVLFDGQPHLVVAHWETVDEPMQRARTMKLRVYVDEGTPAVSEEEMIAADFLEENGFPNAAAKLRQPAKVFCVPSPRNPDLRLRNLGLMPGIEGG